MPDPVDVACTTDRRYAPHTAAMLHSLLEANPGEAFRIHVLHEALGPDDAERLRQTGAAYGASFEFHVVDTARMRGFPTRTFHASCWYRIFLPELLPNLTTVLYLDSDMVVLDRIRPLWETDVSDHPFAAAANPLYPFMPNFPRTALGIADPRRYFNSGVLLMNLARLRSAGAVARLRAYAQAHPDNLYPEQDALSALFHAECLPLHLRWNAQSTLWDLRPEQLPLPRDEVDEARRRPAIVHFIGPYKPWQYLCRHPLRHLYFTHRAQTPWPVAAVEGRTLRNVLLRPLPVAWHDRWHRVETGLRRRARRLLLRPAP